MAVQPMNAEILRRALHARRLACSNLCNLARSMFKADTKIMYRITTKAGVQDVIGEIQSVYPEVYDVMIDVKAPNGRVRKIRLDQVLGLMEDVYASE